MLGTLDRGLCSIFFSPLQPQRREVNDRIGRLKKTFFIAHKLCRNFLCVCVCVRFIVQGPFCCSCCLCVCSAAAASRERLTISRVLYLTKKQGRWKTFKRTLNKTNVRKKNPQLFDCFVKAFYWWWLQPSWPQPNNLWIAPTRHFLFSRAVCESLNKTRVVKQKPPSCLFPVSNRKCFQSTSFHLRWW